MGKKQQQQIVTVFHLKCVLFKPDHIHYVYMNILCCCLIGLSFCHFFFFFYKPRSSVSLACEKITGLYNYLLCLPKFAAAPESILKSSCELCTKNQMPEKPPKFTRDPLEVEASSKKKKGKKKKKS